MAENTETQDKVSAMTKLLDWSYDKVISGAGPVKGTDEIVEEYLKKHSTKEKAIDAFLKFQLRDAATVGFVSGIPGGLTMAVAMPADLANVIFVQLRVIAVIAAFNGYDVRDDEVRSIAYVTLTGSTVANFARDAGIKLSQKAGINLVQKIPGKVLVSINKKVGIRLVTKFGQKGVVNLAKMVPVLGGVVGGAFDFSSTRVIAKYAKKNFPSYATNIDTDRL